MERPRGDEQDVVGLDGAVFGRHRRALHQRQQVPLHALARHLCPTALTARGDLVQLVQKHDAVLFGIGDGLAANVFFVDEFRCLFIEQQLHGLGNLELAGFAFASPHLAEHATQLLGHFLHARRPHQLHLGWGVGDIDFDILVVQRTFPQLLAKHLACRTVTAGGGCVRAAHRTGRWNQDIQNAVFGGIFGAQAYLAHFGLTRLFDGNFSQVADDGIHILANIPHLGELGGFDLDEGSIRQTGQAAGDLGLAHARGADHEDVLGCDFVAQGHIHVLAAPAVAQRNGHGTFGAGLAHDVAVEFGDDFLGGHGGHGACLFFQYTIGL